MTDPTVEAPAQVPVSARWTAEAIAHLVGERGCPRCTVAVVTGGVCPACGAVIDAASLERLRAASVAAAEALRRRQLVVDGLATRGATGATRGATGTTAGASGTTAGRAPGTAGAAARPSTTVAGPGAADVLRPYPGATPLGRPSPSDGTDAAEGAAGRLSVQSVLSVAGAGLIAIASLVFAYLSPELSDVAARSAVLGVVAALFLVAAGALHRAALTFSAETVGLLGLVFTLVAGSSASALVVEGPATRLLGGALLLLGSVAAIAAGRRVRLRTWVWGGVVGAALAPAVLVSALEGTVAAVAGSYAAGISIAASGLVLHPVLDRLSPALGSPLRTDRITLLALQLTGAGTAALTIVGSQGLAPDAVSIAALLALAVVCAGSARFALPRLWSVAAGVLAVGAAASVSLAVPGLGAWSILAIVTAAHAALLGLAALPSPRGVDRPALVWSAWATARLTLTPIGLVVVPFALIVTPVLPRTVDIGTGGDPTSFLIAAICSLVVGAAASRALRASTPPTGAPDLVVASVCLSLAVILAATGWSLPLPVRGTAALIAATALALAVRRRRRRRTAGSGLLVAPVLAAHVLLAYAAATAFSADWSLLLVGAGTVAATALAATLVPARARPAYIAAGVLYALVVLLVSVLRLSPLDPTAALCIAATAGVLTAFVATSLHRIGTAEWIAFLGSAAAPFLVAVGLVLVDRTAWTALPTAASVVLATVVLTERSRPVPVWLRCLAAAVVVPGVAVIIVTLGAQLLPVSGSPVTLPIIAAIVAVALGGGGRIASLLERRGIAGVPAIRLAGELASLLTGSIAVLLAYARPAAGPGIAVVVLLVLGLGGLALARVAGRRWGWWIAGAAWTGALWSLWILLDVPVLEAYLAPPAIAALVVGASACARGRGGVSLFAVGAGALVLPALLALVVIGSADAVAGGSAPQPPLPWRTDALLGVAALLCTLPVVLRRTRWSGRTRPLAPVSAIAALVAASAGAVQALRYGLGVDPTAVPAAHVIVPVLIYSVLSAALAARAGYELARGAGNRALLVPALGLLVVGPLTANRPDPLPLVLLSLLSALLLAGMIATTVRGIRGPTVLPPVWVWFAAAWAVAVAAWSTRELRVEAFSLPLGAALLVSGVLALRAAAAPPADAPTAPTAAAWPVGFRSSWALFAPGLVVCLAPSVTATGTDPLTWRAVLVMAIALACILAGSLLRLAAPFVLGLIVLPIENVVVFAVQIGRSIEAMPWWITLAAAGAVLLVLAVTAERRSTGPRSPLARLRDLR